MVHVIQNEGRPVCRLLDQGGDCRQPEWRKDPPEWRKDPPEWRKDLWMRLEASCAVARPDLCIEPLELCRQLPPHHFLRVS